MASTGYTSESIFRGAGEMARAMRAYPWADSPFGDPSEWPQSLRTAVSICLTSRFPIVLWWGPELRLIYNDAWRPALGENKHPAVGKPGSEVWSEIWHLIGPMLEGVVATGEATWSEDMLLPMDRYGYLEETYWTYSYSPIVVEDGTIGGVFTAVTETTGRVLAERRVQTLRDLGALAGSAPTGEGAARRVVETLAGRPDVRGSAIFRGGSLVASSFAERPDEAAVAAVLARGEPVETTRPVHALALPLRGAGLDRVDGALVVGVNPERALDDAYRGHLGLVAEQAERLISAAQALDEERRRAEELAELDRAKTVFFGNVSHELRTPLTLILGPLEEALARPEELTPEQLERAQVVRRNALRLLRLVNTLLDFSRAEAGRTVGTYRPTDLRALTAELASSFRAAFERGGLEYEIELEGPARPVYADAEAWEKIVLNLLSNAFKFTVSGRVTVRLADAGDGVRLEVADTGTSVPADELPRLFERFHRVRNDEARSHEGTGIGLALVRELVQLHGGEVGAESALGRGTTIRVELPYGHEHLPAERVRHDAAAAGGTGALPFVEEALRWLPDGDGAEAATSEADFVAREDGAGAERPRLVVVDDNADMRAYVARLLSPSFDVVSYPDGAAALAGIRERRPDVVVSDVMMPVLDGFGLLAAIRSDAQLAALPVILVSARAGEESSVEGLGAGADDYLVKPFSARELQARVRVTLELARLREEAARLAALEDVRTRVITTVSHELRTPVTAIYGAAKTLDRIGLLDDETQRELLAVIGTQAERLARITSDILTAETLVKDVVHVTPESLDARGAVAEVVAARRAMLPPGIELKAHAPNEAVVVWADRARLQQVLTNLLDNAIKYSPQGGAVCVSVAAGDAGEVRFAVEDEGLGVPPPLRSRIFERFYRVDPEMTGGVGGSGLGLYICRELVEAMGGRVWLEENEPRGTRFVVALPAAPAQP